MKLAAAKVRQGLFSYLHYSYHIYVLPVFNDKSNWLDSNVEKVKYAIVMFILQNLWRLMVYGTQYLPRVEK